jgi:hypothetical protein
MLYHTSTCRWRCHKGEMHQMLKREVMCMEDREVAELI